MWWLLSFPSSGLATAFRTAACFRLQGVLTRLVALEMFGASVLALSTYFFWRAETTRQGLCKAVPGSAVLGQCFVKRCLCLCFQTDLLTLPRYMAGKEPGPRIYLQMVTVYAKA
jgi:hypothetical protein